MALMICDKRLMNSMLCCQQKQFYKEVQGDLKNAFKVWVFCVLSTRLSRAADKYEDLVLVSWVMEASTNVNVAVAPFMMTTYQE